MVPRRDFAAQPSNDRIATKPPQRFLTPYPQPELAIQGPGEVEAQHLQGISPISRSPVRGSQRALHHRMNTGARSKSAASDSIKARTDWRRAWAATIRAADLAP